MLTKKGLNSWLYFPVFVLLVNFIFRLIDQSKMIRFFPLDYVNDISSYIAQLFFLVECGFYKFCPYWYNGFVTFQFTPPLWFFVALPFYYITNDFLMATYSVLIFSFLTGFLVFWFFGKLHKLSKLERVAYFLFFFGNAIAIGNFIRLGRFHELLAWVLFAILGFMFLFYKDKKLDKKFYFSGIVLGLIVLTHQVVAMLASFLFLSLFLVKKERWKIVGSYLIGLVISAFWWWPFVKGFAGVAASSYVATKALLNFSPNYLFQTLASFIIPLIFIVIFYFYWKSNNKKKSDLMFYLPWVVFAVLLFFRLTPFIPIIKYIYPDPWHYSFIFLSLFMFFKIKFKRINHWIYVMGIVFIYVLVIVSVLFNMFITPLFQEHGDVERDILSIMDDVEGNFLIVGLTREEAPWSYAKAYASYGPVYKNLTTSSGWYFSYMTQEYKDVLYSIGDFVKAENCEKVIESFKYVNAKSIIGYGDSCDVLLSCGLEERNKKGAVCLYYLK